MNSYGRPRRHRDKGRDEDRTTRGGSRRDDRVDEYSASYSYAHPTESYRTSSTYELDREPSSSTRRADDWRHEDGYGHQSSDPFGRSVREPTYEHPDPREDSGWNGRAHHSSSNAQWPDRYETKSYTESRDWYDRGPEVYAEDTRSDQYHAERGRSRADERGRYDDAYERPRDYEGEWRQSTRPSAQHDDGWTDAPRRQWGNSHNATSSREPAEDRSWEPAASWRSREASSYTPKNQQNYRNNYNNKKSKKNRNNFNPRKQQRERTHDEGPNNWTRRTPAGTSSKNDKTSKKRRQRSPSRSRSRSRSRSPAASHYSRRTSRSRSPAWSETSKRRKRDSSLTDRRSRSPEDRRTPRKPQGRPSRRTPSRSSRSPAESRGRGRRPSVSSISSPGRSRSRSRSHSPLNRPKPKHRLPPATSVDSISLSKATLLKTSKELLPREGGKDRIAPISLKHTNGRHAEQAAAAAGNANVHANSVDVSIGATSMGPPPQPTPNAGTITVVGAPPAKSSPPMFSARPAGKPGFRPIGAASSSMKRFFPSDEEEDTAASATTTTASVQPTVVGRVEHAAERTPERDNSPSTRAQSNGVRSGRESTEPSRGHTPVSTDAEQAVPAQTVGATKRANDGDMTSDVSNENLPGTDRAGQITPSPLPLPPPPPQELYSIVSQVGEGTFGKVYKARNAVTGVHVALKRIRMEAERDGFPVTAMREIKLLQSLRHENIVRLYEMMVSNGNVYMVFEYMDHDLTGILSQTQFSFTDANLKSLCQQMLAGLAYLHHKGVIHRDIKGSNILVNNRGELKLADFGLARFYQKRRRSDYTNRVITLWYRPPELLYGATVYGPEVDMWSAGCIMLELFTKKPVFQGNDEIHQLDVIFKILGTPTTERWPGVTELPWFELVKPKEVIPNHFRGLFQKWMSPAALDLAEQLLDYEPSRRISAVQALDAPYFTQEDPPAVLPTDLSSLEGEWHELETKRERAKKKRKTEGPGQA